MNGAGPREKRIGLSTAATLHLPGVLVQGRVLGIAGTGGCGVE